jgi:hypothetical protein
MWHYAETSATVFRPFEGCQLLNWFSREEECNGEESNEEEGNEKEGN